MGTGHVCVLVEQRLPAHPVLFACLYSPNKLDTLGLPHLSHHHGLWPQAPVGGPYTTRGARVGFVDDGFTRVRGMTQTCGGAAGRKSFTVTGEVLHLLLRGPEHLAQAVYGGFKSLDGNQTLSQDKTFVCNGFCLVLNVSWRTGGKEGMAQVCRQHSTMAGAGSSMIYRP